MRRRLFKTLILLGAICLMLVAGGCGDAQESDNEALLQDCPLIHEETTSGVYLDISIDDFNALGFEYGDSVDIAFSNGYEMEDIPYFSGYYVEAYAPLVVGYPGSDHVKVTINYGEDLWDIAEFGEGDTASLCINAKGKYLEDQKAGDIHYTDERDDYASDEVFANFRNSAAGDIGENVLYRSASPCDNRHNRAAYADDLAAKAGIGCIVDLADGEEEIEGYIASENFDSPYFLKLYQEGEVLPLDLSMNFLDKDFQRVLVKGLTDMVSHKGPYLVHCTEGKDRTGFVCMLLEALCGATYPEIVDDYMLSYENYYGINEESDPERYNTIKEQNIDMMLEAVVSDETVDITSVDLSEYAKDYLVRIGVSEKTVDELKERLAEEPEAAE